MLKKTSKIMFASAFMWSFSAAATVDTRIEWSGDYRLRGQYLESASTDSSDPQDFYNHRMIVSGKMVPNDSIQAHLSLNINQNLGSEDRFGFAGLRDTDPDDEDVQILRAYGDWAFGSAFSLKFGRLDLNWANEAVISRNNDDQRPFFFDGVVFGYDALSFSINVGALKVSDWLAVNTDAGDADPDESSYFVSIDFKPISRLIEKSQIFFLRFQSDNFSSPAVNIEGSSLNRLGFSSSGSSGVISYDLDYVSLLGSFNGGQSANAWMGNLKLGLNFGDKTPQQFFLKAHFDSGDDQATTDKNESYRPLYYNHHRYAGLLDVLAWGNLNYLGAGFSMIRKERSEFLFQALWFKLSDTSQGPNSISYLGFGDDTDFISQAVSENTNNIADTDLGFEFDFLFKRTFSSKAYVEFIAGVFVPGKYFEAYGRDKEILSFRLTTGFEF